MRFLATDPILFNDPFEVRPYFDQERHDHSARTHEQFHARFGIPHSLIPGRSMVGMPPENAAGFAEEFNQRFRRYLSMRFRVLCLCKTPASAVMWAHYGDSHKGITVGVETEGTGLHHGLKPMGFEINYTKTRDGVKLPLAFYQTPSVEEYGPGFTIVNNPNQLVQSDGGIVIPFSEYRRQVEEIGLLAIQTKYLDWSYEQEVRFIYQLPEQSDQLRRENNLDFVQIPAKALREITFGYNAPFSLVERIIGWFKAGKLGGPKLFFAECHPFLHEVHRFEANADYLIEYYRHVVPSHR